MKRILSLITVFALCMSLLVCVASAADFVPSIGDKDHPEIIPNPDGSIAEIIDGNGAVQDVVGNDCLIITPVSEAGTSTDIPEDAKEELLDVYEQLSNGGMNLPYDESVNPEDMVIRDLFDLTFLCEEHPEMLDEGGKLRVNFDLGVQAGDTVICMVYVDGQWLPVELVNNGDGSVTCLFTDVCPVVFAVKQSETPPDTGDYLGNSAALWIGLMVISAAAIVAFALVYGKKIRKEN